MKNPLKRVKVPKGRASVKRTDFVTIKAEARAGKSARPRPITSVDIERAAASPIRYNILTAPPRSEWAARHIK